MFILHHVVDYYYQEYGITKAEKMDIALGYCVPLLRKIKVDLQRNLEEETYRLNPKYVALLQECVMLKYLFFNIDLLSSFSLNENNNSDVSQFFCIVECCTLLMSWVLSRTTLVSISS